MNVIEGDTHIAGRLTAQTMTIPTDAVSNDSVRSDAALSATKIQHQLHPCFGQEVTANAAADERVIHVARGAGTIEDFVAGIRSAPDTAIGSSGRYAVVDVKKNGTTVLTAPLTFSSTASVTSSTQGTISVGSYAVGDIFTQVITVGGSAGTHAKGAYGQLTLNEAAAP